MPRFGVPIERYESCRGNWRLCGGLVSSGEGLPMEPDPITLNATSR